MAELRYKIEQNEDGVFVATCPLFEDCVSQGKTYEEAKANLRKAIRGYIESLTNHMQEVNDNE